MGKRGKETDMLGSLICYAHRLGYYNLLNPSENLTYLLVRFSEPRWSRTTIERTFIRLWHFYVKYISYYILIPSKEKIY